MKVNLIPNYSYPDLLRQTPGEKGVWGNHEFSIKSKNESDVVIIFNRPDEDLDILCKKGGLWLCHQETLDEGNFGLLKYPPFFDKVYTQSDLNHKDVVNTQTFLPWHVNMNYDELVKLTPSKNKEGIVWITSNLRKKEGHRIRMDFLDDTQGKLDFKLYGKGFQFIDCKDEVLLPAKYNIAIENTKIDHYWTEKIIDAYLTWCMPIYCGAPNILDYFPEESMILIDITKPDQAIEVIKEAVISKKWEKNIDAIEFARNKILNEFQLFPALSQIIDNNTNLSKAPLKNHYLPYDGDVKKGRVRRLKSKVKNIFK